MENLTTELISLERHALDLWIEGNPDGFLDLSAPDVTYFDPFLRKRLNGLGELREHYEGLRGRISADYYEIIDPRAVSGNDFAVLSFNFEAHGGEDVCSWNCTESFRRTGGKWWLVQTHWSVTGAELPS